MILHAGEDHPIYGPRLRAFDMELSQHHSIEVFARLDCHDNPITARQLMRERTARFPRLSAWVCLGDWPTRGLEHEADLGLPPTCKIFIVGGMPEQWPLVQSGRVPLIVSNDYHEIGWQALQLCEIAIRKRSSFLQRYLAPLRVIKPDTLDKFMHDWELWRMPRTSREYTPGAER
jgi:ABC-type sugar transport system substrate-binding protein